MTEAGQDLPPGATGPDFLGIGAMKAGTTWLHDNLADHRGIWLPPLKELRYFNTLHIPGPHQQTDQAGRAEAIAARRARLAAPGRPLGPRQTRLLACLDAMAEPQSDAWYCRIFSFRNRGDVAGDICPQYAVLPEAGIRHALALNPRLKAVALLRDPASRALAHMAMHCGPGATAEAVLRLMQTPRWALYAAYSDYATWLACWRDTLPAGALHVEVMPAIRREPHAVLRRICGFLGVPAGPQSFPRAAQAVMVGKSDRSALAPALPVLREALAPAYAALEAGWPDLAAALREDR
jgi:hypothetical protein